MDFVIDAGGVMRESGSTSVGDALFWLRSVVGVGVGGACDKDMSDLIVQLEFWLLFEFQRATGLELDAKTQKMNFTVMIRAFWRFNPR